MNMSAQLKDRIAIVTGGAQGLGQAVSERLAREGCQVVIADVNEQGVTETAGAIAQATGIPLVTLSRRLTGHSSFLITEIGVIARALGTTPLALITAADEAVAR